MTDGLADTSFFIASEAGRPLRSEDLPGRLSVSIVTIAELRAGVLLAADLETRDRRLSTLTVALSLQPHSIDDRVAESWARLRVALMSAGMRMPVNDSWIAATAIALGVPLVTQDPDFDGVPGLSVVRI